MIISASSISEAYEKYSHAIETHEVIHEFLGVDTDQKYTTNVGSALTIKDKSGQPINVRLVSLKNTRTKDFDREYDTFYKKYTTKAKIKRTDNPPPDNASISNIKITNVTSYELLEHLGHIADEIFQSSGYTGYSYPAKGIYSDESDMQYVYVKYISENEIVFVKDCFDRDLKKYIISFQSYDIKIMDENETKIDTSLKNIFKKIFFRENMTRTSSSEVQSINEVISMVDKENVSKEFQDVVKSAIRAINTHKDKNLYFRASEDTSLLNYYTKTKKELGNKGCANVVIIARKENMISTTAARSIASLATNTVSDAIFVHPVIRDALRSAGFKDGKVVGVNKYMYKEGKTKDGTPCLYISRCSTNPISLGLTMKVWFYCIEDTDKTRKVYIESVSSLEDETKGGTSQMVYSAKNMHSLLHLNEGIHSFQKSENDFGEWVLIGDGGNKEVFVHVAGITEFRSSDYTAEKDRLLDSLNVSKYDEIVEDNDAVTILVFHNVSRMQVNNFRRTIKNLFEGYTVSDHSDPRVETCFIKLLNEEELMFCGTRYFPREGNYELYIVSRNIVEITDTKPEFISNGDRVGLFDRVRKIFIKEDGVLNHDMELATGKEASDTEPNTDGFEGIKAEDLYYTPDSLGLTRSEELTKSDYSDFFRDPKVTEQFNEYFDISDRFTRKALLTLNEADQNTVLVALTSKLYDSIVNKVDEIDFGDIPNTKGDITKLPNYEKIRECISIIRDILVEYKEDTAPVDEVSNALSHISTRKEMFERAFRTDAELPIITYNSIVLAIVNSVSYMIATSIEFIKTPNQDTFKIVLDKVGYARSKHSLLYNNLKRFNKCCESGEFDKAMEHVIQQRIDNKAMREGAISTTVAGVLGASAVTIAIVAIIANIIPILRELVFFFYYTRMRVSDFFDIQADLLQMNAHNLDTSSDRADKDRVVSKQLKVVEMFRKIANKISFTGRKAEVSAEKEITASSKKMKLGDVVDEMPDSVSSALF